jgi:hypothetical protein
VEWFWHIIIVFVFLFLFPLRMATWVAETCRWLLCTKITFIHLLGPLIMTPLWLSGTFGDVWLGSEQTQQHPSVFLVLLKYFIHLYEYCICKIFFVLFVETCELASIWYDRLSFLNFFFFNSQLTVPLYYLLVSDKHKQCDASLSVDILTAVSQ